MARGPRPQLDTLSPRELDCLRLVQDQMSSKEIGRRLGISPTSVDTHVRRAREKLGVADRHAAAQLLESWDRGSSTEGPASEMQRAYPAAAAAGRGWALPPLEQLNVVQKLLLVVAGAAMGAIVFGVVLTALAALFD